MSYCIGIDLGGTSIKAGIVDDEGKIVRKLSRPTKSERGSMTVIKDMARLAFELSEGSGILMPEISSIGIGCPGSINRAEGKIEFSGNLYWYGVPIAECMQNLTGKRIYLENDANAAAFGEYVAGSLKGTRSSLLITLGTGVGSGIILDGGIFVGSNGMGGELGHMVIAENGRQCTCGRRGCLEAYASASALIGRAREAMRKKPDSVLWELCGGNILLVNGELTFKAAAMGDAAAKETVDEFLTYLSSGIVSAVNILQPELVAIGGGLSGSADAMLPRLNEALSAEVFSRHHGAQCRVIKAQLGNDAGIIGAAMLWKNKNTEKLGG